MPHTGKDLRMTFFKWSVLAYLSPTEINGWSKSGVSNSFRPMHQMSGTRPVCGLAWTLRPALHVSWSNRSGCHIMCGPAPGLWCMQQPPCCSEIALHMAVTTGMCCFVPEVPEQPLHTAQSWSSVWQLHAAWGRHSRASECMLDWLLHAVQHQ